MTRAPNDVRGPRHVWRLVLDRDQQHRADRLPQDVDRRGPEQHAAQAAASSGTDDDQLGLVREFEQRLTSVADVDPHLEGDVVPDPGTLTLAGLELTALAAFRRRR